MDAEKKEKSEDHSQSPLEKCILAAIYENTKPGQCTYHYEALIEHMQGYSRNPTRKKRRKQKHIYKTINKTSVKLSLQNKKTKADK